MILTAAMVLDAVLGEPKWLWDRVPHPAVVMGRSISWLEARMNTGARRLMGVLMVVVIVGIAGLIGVLIAATLRTFVERAHRRNTSGATQLM